MPAPGDITVGGMLAINAHGSAIPGTGETRQPGQTYGSLSNPILSLTTVVWFTANPG
jgi:FAD/FMN-containing dehydrogenase